MKKIVASLIIILLAMLVACQSFMYRSSADNMVEITRVITEVETEEMASEPLAGNALTYDAAIAPTEGNHSRNNTDVPQDMYFTDYGQNPFVNTSEDNLSTFAIDVDTGSYTLMRRYLTDGGFPPPESVRIEEYVNYFNYSYDQPVDKSFAIHLDGAPSPFSIEEGEYLVRVGIQGYEVPAAERPDMLLIFVVDSSGSMAGGNRLGQVQASLAMLTEQLRPGDRIGIIEYGSQARVVLEPTEVRDSRGIFQGINRLEPNGSTNAEHGLMLAYQMAQSFREGTQPTRLILCSDGVANVGNTTAEAILEHAEEGITLSTFGFGMGNYNDVLMEQLADQGDGVYAYVDTPDEAERLFVHNLTGTLLTIAKDAKIQVEFNPEVVAGYRLLGYENRDVADEDFRNDDVDAGEIGAGHSVTALYAVRSVAEPVLEQPALTVRVRYTEPETNEVIELSEQMTWQEMAPTFNEAPLSFQLAVVVAQYADQLRRHNNGDVEYNLDALLQEARRIAEFFPGNQDVQEFVNLLALANDRG